MPMLRCFRWLRSASDDRDPSSDAGSIRGMADGLSSARSRGMVGHCDLISSASCGLRYLDGLRYGISFFFLRLSRRSFCASFSPSRPSSPGLLSADCSDRISVTVTGQRVLEHHSVRRPQEG
ncbi:hypothetical protein XPA_001285 [Xanthoria parietina]